MLFKQLLRYHIIDSYKFTPLHIFETLSELDKCLKLCADICLNGNGTYIIFHQNHTKTCIKAIVNDEGVKTHLDRSEYNSKYGYKSLSDIQKQLFTLGQKRACFRYLTLN